MSNSFYLTDSVLFDLWYYGHEINVRSFTGEHGEKYDSKIALAKGFLP